MVQGRLKELTFEDIYMIKSFRTAATVYHGEGSSAAIGDILESTGMTKIGLLADPGLYDTGLVDDLKRHLGHEVEEFNGIEPEPPVQLVEDIVRLFREKNIEILICLGGGSCIDIGKMVSAMLKNEGSVSDYFGVNKIKKPGIPVVAVPTTSRTGSEVSPAAIFYDSSDHTKKGVRSDFLYPDYVILDPVLTYSLPPAITASTGMDALTHAIEGFTSKNSTCISDLFAREAIRLIGIHLRKAYFNGREPECRGSIADGELLRRDYPGYRKRRSRPCPCPDDRRHVQDQSRRYKCLPPSICHGIQ